MQNIVTFHAQLEHLPDMLLWVRQHLHTLSWGAAEKNKFEIAAEEILVNIICYAYEDGNGMVEMQWQEQIPFVCLTFKDFGVPFNPLKHHKPPTKSLSIDSKAVGGLGIFFIKNFVDKVEYQRTEDANVLTISKNMN